MTYHLLVLILLTALSSCGSDEVLIDEVDTAVAGEADADADSNDEAKQVDQEALTELEDHRRELFILEMKTEHTLRSAHLELTEADEALQDAHRELRLFMSVEMPRQIENQQQSLSYSRHSVKNAEEELAQLEQLYGDAEFAEATAEIVIGRSRHSLEMERIDLRQSEENLRNLHKYELPKEIEDLEHSIRRAEHELEGARIEMEVAEIEAEHELKSAIEEVEKLEKGLGMDEHDHSDDHDE